MALSQVLGDTSEIKLIDFFISDGGNSYNISELNEHTGLSRVTLTKKIPELIQNKILEVDQQAGGIRTFRLARSKIVDLLAAAILVNSFDYAEEPLGEEETLQNIRDTTDLEEMPGDPISVSGYKIDGKTIIIIND
jgi:DNA-binding transcriptional ArsR family regulator